MKNRFLSSEEVARRLKSMFCKNEESYSELKDRITFTCELCHVNFKSSLMSLFGSRNLDEQEPGCPICFKKHRDAKRESERLAKLTECARRKGGEVLSKSLPGIKNKVVMRCQYGHEWSATAQSVLHGSWCPRCSPSFPRTLDELNEIVIRRNGRLISSEYKGVDAKYEFECSLGHYFQNSFKKIEYGQWCPTCNKGKISEEIVRTTFEQIFGIPFIKERPNWLRNSRGRQMELDGANLSLGVAFEYQGIQHFKLGTQYITTEEALSQRRLDDELKIDLCNRHGVSLVVLTYEMERTGFSKEIEKQLNQLGFDTKKFNFDVEIDLSKAYVRQDRLIELRTLLSRKGITVLSDAWLGVAHRYELRCDVCGSEWKAQGNAFFNSHRVAGCDFCNRKAQGEKHKLGIESLIEFASRFGGELLSGEYVQRRWIYKWRCSEGHEFDGNFNNMVFRNQFCPKCEMRDTKVIGNLQLLQDFAKQHNGKFLSKEFLKKSSKYQWVCSNGHEFERSFAQMLQASHFCALCGKDVPRFADKKVERFLGLVEFAAKHDGQVLDSEYQGRDHKYTWRCSVGHEFTRNYSDMKFRNKFCWFCDGTKQ
jgi:hypothetical protein